MKRLLSAFLFLAAAGCASHAETGIWGRHEDVQIETVAAPKVDRCEKFKSAGSMFDRCQEFKQQAANYLHSLNTGEMVCMEGGFGEDQVTDKCKARGHIEDADNHGFLIQMREPRLDSRWKDYDGKKVFFENGALVDLYLAESGFE